MMNVKVETVGNGIHPSEIVVAVQTVDGQQNLVVDKRSISESTIKVGYPIRQNGDNLLIELPRETVSGAWRVWVDKDQVTEGEQQTAA